MNEEAIEKREYRGFEIHIFPDPYPENPRHWDNVTSMWCFHSRYDLGDKHDFRSMEEARACINRNNLLAIRLNLYDHSRISISTSNGYPYNDRWDSSFVGWAVIEIPEDLCPKWKRWSRQRIQRGIEAIESEVATYDTYLRGDVYGFKVVKDGITYGEYYGYYGYDHKVSGLDDEAESMVDNIISTAVNARVNKLKGYIKAHVPFIYRQPFDPYNNGIYI